MSKREMSCPMVIVDGNMLSGLLAGAKTVVAESAAPHTDMQKMSTGGNAMETASATGVPPQNEVTEEMASSPYMALRKHMPFWEKSNLTLEEAAVYSGVGIHKLREITDQRGCKFVLWNGSKRLIKRRLLDEYLETSYTL